MKSQQNPKPIKILLVSDTTSFALTDVYYGYERALTTLKIPHVSFPFHHFRSFHKRAVCLQMMHSEAMMKRNGYTHVMFIGGLNIPRDMLESFPGLETIVVSTEDPHSFDPMQKNLDVIDHYFTNERAVAAWAEEKDIDHVHYCPTAVDTHACGALPVDQLEEKYRSDIVFLGALYPNRQKYLKALLPLVKSRKWDLKILGHPHYVPKESPLWEFIPPENFNPDGSIRTIPHEETVRYYNGARVVLNFMRDTKWNPTTNSMDNPLNENNILAESLNPRAYEIPLCGSVQLLEATRAEAREVFDPTEACFFESEEELQGQVQLILDQKESCKEMVSRAAQKVLMSHTYVHRMQSILKVVSP